jgi:hypothetical protein
MTVHRTFAEISVEDRAPAAARLKLARMEDSSGRGLAMVAALSSQWGQEPFDGVRKKVWSRVPVPPGSVSSRYCTL